MGLRLAVRGGSVVGVTLVAQVHRLLQRLAGLLSLFAHAVHVLNKKCLRQNDWYVAGFALEPDSVNAVSSARGISAARG